MVGSVGGGGRLGSAVIGDAVNVAARVEGAIRETGDSVLLTDATRRLLRHPEPVPLEPRGELPLKGKSEPISLWAASAVDGRPTSATQRLTAHA